jgi:transcription factor MBP1
MLAERNNILDKLSLIFDYTSGDRSPPPAPKHVTASSKPRAPRVSAAAKRMMAEEMSFNSIRPPRISASSFSHEQQYEMAAPPFEEDESMEQTTLESSSMMAEEDMVPMSQHSTHSRKRKRGVNEATAMTVSEQEHILYGDQLLDYFMTVGDAPEAARIQPPVPPANFQVDRPIDDSGNTALHWASAMGDLDIVRDLLRRGANVNALSVHEETPLVRAVLFTNNYEKRTMPTMVNLLQENLAFRDWFGATVFHHLAETTRSKGKWKSARYYCDVLLQKFRDTFPKDDLNQLLCCQDSNGDTPALVAARNGNFRLVTLLLLHCPDAGNLVNKKGETAVGFMDQNSQDHLIPNPPSSVTHGNDRPDGELLGVNDAEHPLDGQANPSPGSSVLLSKIGALMDDAHRKLTQAYGNAKVGQQGADDGAKPQALYEQLESDRQAIQKESFMLSSKEDEGEPFEMQMARYEKLRQRCESYVEQIQQTRLSERIVAASSEVVHGPPRSNPPSQEELVKLYQLARELSSAQKTRRAAASNLIQQKADAGVSTKLDTHRKLVALATGLKEEELDPMAAELAETLEFDRINGRSAGVNSPEQRPILNKESLSSAVMPVDI